MTVTKIISGGQAGADRAAQETSWDIGLETGGWAPRGWRAEDGVIPEVYRRGMVEHQSSSYPPRTERNVLDSDGTLILSFGDLTYDSGSYLTAKLARKHGKPCRHFKIAPLDQELSPVLIRLAREWIHEHNIQVLNVAGPRESREPGLQLAARYALNRILRPPTAPG